jgi:ribonuclease D
MHKIKRRDQLAIIKELWVARDRVASEQDIAPGKLLNDSAIVELAMAASVTKKEFEKAMKSLKIECNPKEMDAIFEVIDRDSSGSIDYNEFLAVLGYSARGREGETKRAY